MTLKPQDRKEPLIPLGDEGPAYTRCWIDEQTGREVRMLTKPGDRRRVYLPYFMTWKHLADGRLLCGKRIFDPRTGAVTTLPRLGDVMQISPDGKRIYCWKQRSRTVVALVLPDLQVETIGRVTDARYPDGGYVSCDGHTLIGWSFSELGEAVSPFGQPDPEVLWRFFDRPRAADLWAYDLPTGQLTQLAHTDGLGIIYVMPSPTDPTLIKFCHDRHEATCQRIWTVRTDGSAMCPVRPQERGEVVTHDIWWPDGRYIAYKYLDRRDDPTLIQVPWSEYAPVPTRLGLAGPDGLQIYLSDPLVSYQSHINVSRNGHLLSGEGTHDHPFIYAAAFSPVSTDIDFIPQATIHTPYSPMGGHGLQADFTADGQWILYHDTIDGEHHMCAVRVEV